MFPQCFPVSHTGNIASRDANYAYATQQGILTKIRASEQLQKFCEHEQASTHLIFASNSNKGEILQWMGPFDTPTSDDSEEEIIEEFGSSDDTSDGELHPQLITTTRSGSMENAEFQVSNYVKLYVIAGGGGGGALK